MASRAVREENPVVADVMRALASDGARSTRVEYLPEVEMRHAAQQERLAELRYERQQPAPAPVAPLRQRVAAALVALAARVAPAPRETDSVLGAEVLAVRHP